MEEKKQFFQGRINYLGAVEVISLTPGLSSRPVIFFGGSSISPLKIWALEPSSLVDLSAEAELET